MLKGMKVLTVLKDFKVHIIMKQEENAVMVTVICMEALSLISFAANVLKSAQCWLKEICFPCGKCITTIQIIFNQNKFDDDCAIFNSTKKILR